MLNLWASTSSRAELRPHPVVELTTHLFTGTTGKSLKGARGYSAVFRSEDIQGVFRPHVAFEFGYHSGLASIGTNTPAFSMYRASFLPGANFFIIPNGGFQPFIGMNANVGWDFFKMAAPPTGIEGNTQGFSYGYEVSAGVDIRIQQFHAEAWRVTSSVLTIFSGVAGQSGFQLNSFRLGLGHVF